MTVETLYLGYKVFISKGTLDGKYIENSSMTVDQFNITGNYTSASWQNATIYAGNISLTFSSLNQQQKDSNDWWLSTQNGFHNTWTNVFIIVGAVFFFSLIWVYAYIKYRKNPYIPPPPPPEMTEDEILQRADSFLVTYPPDTESTLLVLKTVNILPTSMENANSPSFLLIRQFEDFPIKKPSAVEISAMTDSQTIEFIGNTECSIQTNTPLKPHDLSISAPIPPPSFVSTPNTIILEQCYYEIKIIQLEPKTTFAFGFAACPYPPFRLPGYDEHSIGYFSSTGRVHLNNRGNGVGCGLPLIQGDTVGIGYRIIHLPKIRDHELIETVFYFTHNGVRIGDEFVGDGFFPDRIYPTIGATGNCTVQVTFGDPDAVFYPLPVEEITDTIDQANVHAPEQPDDIEMTNLQSTINECSIEMD